MICNDMQLKFIILYAFSYILGQKCKRPYQGNTLDGRSSKRLRERSPVQQGGQLEGSAEEPVALVESALQNTASVYQKCFSQEDRRNLLENLATDLTD